MFELYLPPKTFSINDCTYIEKFKNMNQLKARTRQESWEGVLNDTSDDLKGVVMLAGRILPNTARELHGKALDDLKYSNPWLVAFEPDFTRD